MTDNFNLEIPINPLSFGQIGYNVAVEIWKRGLNPNIYFTAPVDLSAFEVPGGFREWLDKNQKKALKNLDRNQVTLKLWHLNGSERTLTDNAILWTAHELDSLTEEEVAICKKHKKVYVTSDYSREVFENSGLDNVSWLPNFFDSSHFFKTNRTYVSSLDTINFGLFGKLEKRKKTLEVIAMWAQKFGNNPKFRLNCMVYNHFLSPEDNARMIENLFNGRIPWNINILPFQQKNLVYNDCLNAIDIDLSGMSGAEGWNLPLFQCLCLGKQAVVLNAHAHKSYVDADNAILVEPSGKEGAEDGRFFVRGSHFNQGSIFTWNPSDFHAALDKAVEVVKKNNDNGEKLKEKFTVQKTVDELLSNI